MCLSFLNSYEQKTRDKITDLLESCILYSELRSNRTCNPFSVYSTWKVPCLDQAHISINEQMYNIIMRTVFRRLFQFSMIVNKLSLGTTE